MKKPVKRYWSPTTGKVHCTLECANLLRAKIQVVELKENKFPHLPECKKCFKRGVALPTSGKPSRIEIGDNAQFISRAQADVARQNIRATIRILDKHKGDALEAARCSLIDASCELTEYIANNQ